MVSDNCSNLERRLGDGAPMIARGLRCKRVDPPLDGLYVGDHAREDMPHARQAAARECVRALFDVAGSRRDRLRQRLGVAPRQVVDDARQIVEQTSPPEVAPLI